MTYLSRNALNGTPLPRFLPIDTGSNFSIVSHASEKQQWREFYSHRKCVCGVLMLRLVDSRTYPSLYTVSSTRYRLSVTHMSQSFGMHSVNVSTFVDTTKQILPQNLREARARFTGVRGDYASSFDTECSRSPPRGGAHRYEYSHPVLDRHWGSLRYSLTPTTIDDSIKISGCEREMTDSHG